MTQQTTAERITGIIREHLKFYAGSGEWAAATEAGEQIADEIDGLIEQRDFERNVSTALADQYSLLAAERNALKAEVERLKEQNRILATTSLRDVIKSVHPSGRARGQ